MKTISTSLFSVAVLFSAAHLAGCATEDDGDDELDPACEDAKCDAQGGTSAFEVWKGGDGKYYFHLVSDNGSIVLQSQAYTTRASAKAGANSVAANGVDVENYELLQARSGEWYFNLKAGNGAVIGTSEMYTRKYNAQRAIDSVVRLVSEEQRVRAATTGGAKFRAFRGSDNQFYFHLKAGNGEIVLQSQGYASPAGLTTGIASVRSNGKLKSRYRVLVAANGQYYFQLRAANGEVVARGEAYASKANAERAVESLVALIKSELVADPEALPATPARTITSYSQLTQSLGTLGTIAAGGETLQYFGYGEAPAVPAGASCVTRSAAQVASAFSSDVSLVMQDGDTGAASLSQAQVTAMQAEFTQYLGTDSYNLCTTDTEGSATAGQAVFIQSRTAQGPSLAWELGWTAE